MLNSIATLKTPTTCVEVSEATLMEPVETVSKLDRPTLSLLMFGPGYSAEGAFLDGSVRKLSRVGRVLFTPHDREEFGRGACGTLRVVSCSFDRDYCERIVGPLANLSKTQLLGCLDVQSPLLPAMLSRLMTEAIRPGFVSAAVAESLGQAMLVEWSHAVLSQETKHERGRLLPWHFRIVDDYLAALSCEAPSVAAIARACGFSERYFAKLFRTQTNQTIGQYLKAAQISKAQSYLLQSELPLKEVAHRLGFSTPGNFSDAFRAATGVTPGRYRVENRVPALKRIAMN